MTEQRWQKVGVGAALTALLVGVYFLTFSGYAISGDEWALFDATESLARRGNMRLNYEYDQRPPLTLAEVEPPAADTEPLQPALAVPLFWLAEALPGIGLAHTVWLLNIFTTALTAATLYAYGLALGYRARAAAAVALAFGLGTIVWPYSRTFFREPLFMWLALLSAYFMLRIRQRLAAGQGVWYELVAFAAALLGALFSKEAGLLLLPALIVAALPGRRRDFDVTRRSLVLAGAAMLLAVALTLVLLNLDALLGISNRYAFTARLDQARDNLTQMSEGVRGYLYSPARGIWWFSPVLLLGFLGLLRLVRGQRWRELALPLVMLLTFVAGYAAVRGPEWYGGRGWGARYMLPVTPFLALWLLPVAEAVLAARAAAWQRLGALLLLGASISMQIVAAVVPIETYYAHLNAQVPPVIPWLEGAWQVRWSPLVVSLQALDDITLDLAWRHATGSAWLLPLLAAALVVFAGGWLLWWLRRPSYSRRASSLALAALFGATGVVLIGGLYAIRMDPRYYGDFQPARDLLRALDDRVRPHDVIVLNDVTYSEFFMNYYKRGAPVVYTLPLSPGERFSEAQPVALDTPFADERMHLSISLAVAQFAQQHDRLWFVLNSSPYVPWSLRPVEEYLSRHYFAVEAIEPDDLARAVLFDLTPAPLPAAAAWPEHRSDARFGGMLELVGFDVPGGLERRRGDVLPVSLLWRTIASMPEDYTVAVFIIGPDGLPVAQRDSLPANNFGHTSAWRPGALYRDNHGVQLPADLKPGEYALWAAIYWWGAPADRLPVTGAAGDPLGDHAVLGRIVVVP